MNAKACFKCGDSKPLTEFYKHPRMADGRLGKCKDCTRADSQARRLFLESTDADWLEKEAARHREKARRYREQGRVKPQSPAKLRARSMAYYTAHPLKSRANNAVSNAIRDGRLARNPCEVCGSSMAEAHHEDYSKPLEVRWLCRRHHMDRHIEINSKRRLARIAARSE